MTLELVVGMPIMCTKSDVGPNEVVNGTLGHVVKYRLLEIATKHHQVIDQNFGYTKLLSSTLFNIFL
jgi:hypothetical protein